MFNFEQVVLDNSGITIKVENEDGESSRSGWRAETCPDL